MNTPPHIVFLGIASLGWRTCARLLEEHARHRTDFQATHALATPSKLLRVAMRLNRTGPLAGRVAHESLLAVSARPALRRATAAQPADVYHVSPSSLALGLARRRARERFGLSVWFDATARSLHEIGSGPAPTPRTTAAERLIFQRADLCVAWSRWAADAALADHPIDSAKVLVLPPPPPRSGVTEADVRARRTRAVPRMLFVGNQFTRKGGHLLLDWHQRHFADRAELVIVSAEAAPPPAAFNVTLLRDVPHARLFAEVFPSADLFVFPTQSDAYGLVLAEALAAGLPVVTARQAATPEIVRDDDTGYLLPQADHAGFVAAIGRLLSNPDLRERMSLAALADARTRFDGPTVYGELFDRLLTLQG